MANGTEETSQTRYPQSLSELLFAPFAPSINAVIRSGGGEQVFQDRGTRTPAEILYEGSRAPVSAAEQTQRDRRERLRRAINEASVATRPAAAPPRFPLVPEAEGEEPGGVPAAAPTVDMSGILDLLPFAQTEAERAALEQSLADLEARASAGMQALGDEWGRVQRLNSAAKDKAASMVAQVGARAGALWSNLAQAALEKAGVIAGQFGSPAGRQSINIDPTAGAQNYAALMGSLAPAYEMQARQSQERLARDLGFLSEMAGMQGAAYQGELQRTSMIQAADMARRHNEAVAERVAQNRRTAAELMAQAARTNATLAASAADAGESLTPLERLVEQSALQRAAAEALAGRPDAAQQLADITGIDLPTAQALVADVLANR